MSLIRRLIVLVIVAAVAVSSLAVPERPEESTNGLRGINVATLMSQAVTIYGHPEVTDTGEPQATYDALASRGHKLIRLPIDWNYLQPNLGAGDSAFNPAYWKAVRAEVAKIGAAGMKTVLDLHNGCEWKPSRSAAPPLVCGAGLSMDAAIGVWRSLSNQFRGDSSVIAYDLFNEPTAFNSPNPADPQDPRKQPYSAYKDYVNAIVRAIRGNGDRKAIWVESLCCTKNLDIPKTDPNGGWVTDPANRIVYSLHMYPFSGSTRSEEFDPAKLNPRYEEPKGEVWSDLGYVTGFLDRLDAFGAWCRKNRLECSIGEVGWYGPGQSAESSRQWNALGDQWYNIANYYGLAVTYFGASSAYTDNLWVYGAPGPNRWFPAPGMTEKHPQASVIEKRQHLSKTS